ncbi:MAG TPA: hypothetical protein VGC55_07130 [Dokdonella sp.]
MKGSVIRRAAGCGIFVFALGEALARAAAPSVHGTGDVAFYTFEAPDWMLGEFDGQQGWTTDFDGYWTISDAHPYAGSQHMRVAVTSDGFGSAAFSPVLMGVGAQAYSIASTKIAVHQSGSGSDTEFSPLSAAANDYDPSGALPVTRVFVGADGVIKALQPGFTFAPTTGAITDDAYHDLKVITDNSGNAAIEICLDGTSIFNGSSIAATNGTTSFIDSIGLLSTMPMGSIGSTADFDDMRITDADRGGCADAAAWNFDGVVAPALPTGWSTDAAAAGTPWETQTDSADTAPNAAHAIEHDSAAEANLYSATATVDAAGGQLSFRHHWNVESGFDGGVLELSIAGADFVDIVQAGGSFVEAGYNGSLADPSNPLGARPAWTGQQLDFVTTTVDLPDAAAGQPVRFRWRLGSDASGAQDGANGWWVDSVKLAARVLPTQPSAVIAPDHVDIVLEQGAVASQALSIANGGGGTLTYNIPGFAPPAAGVRPAAPPTSTTAAGARVFSRGHRVADGLRGRAIALGAGSGIDIAQMSDATPVASNSLSCGAPGTSTDANSWWRRFYFGEHSQVGASASIDSVTVAAESGPDVPVTINLYAVPHGVAPESIPLDQLTPLGSGSGTVGGVLQATTVAVAGVVADTVNQDLVVEYHIDGSSDGEFFPGGNPSPQTHATFVSASGCGQDVPVDASVLGYPDFHLVMVVNVQDAALPAECSDPSSLAWLSASPATGALGFGASTDVTLGFDAGDLAVGGHDAVMCLTTNDAAHAVVGVPLHVEVIAPANDRIFVNGFELD